MYRLLTALALGTPALVASAQAARYVPAPPQATLAAAQPDTPVPPVLYQSAFAGLPSGVEQTRLDWKKANGAVGQLPRGHADILQWERDHAPAATP